MSTKKRTPADEQLALLHDLIMYQRRGIIRNQAAKIARIVKREPGAIVGIMADRWLIEAFPNVAAAVEQMDCVLCMCPNADACAHDADVRDYCARARTTLEREVAASTLPIRVLVSDINGFSLWTFANTAELAGEDHIGECPAEQIGMETVADHAPDASTLAAGRTARPPTDLLH